MLPLISPLLLHQGREGWIWTQYWTPILNTILRTKTTTTITTTTTTILFWYFSLNHCMWFLNIPKNKCYIAQPLPLTPRFWWRKIWLFFQFHYSHYNNVRCPPKAKIRMKTITMDIHLSVLVQEKDDILYSSNSKINVNKLGLSCAKLSSSWLQAYSVSDWKIIQRVMDLKFVRQNS